MNLGQELLDLVVPQLCAGCGVRGVGWCPGCAADAGQGCLPLAAVRPASGWAAGPHDGPLGRAVVAFKDGGQHRLVGPLGRALAGAVVAALAGAPSGAGPVWLVPVPARGQARRARGLDHTAELAARAARELRRQGVPAHRGRALTRAADSRDQVGLGRQARQANVAGTLRAAALPRGALVVVDDVCTTGATAREALRALSTVTGRPVAVATITRAAGSRPGASGGGDY